MLKKPNSSHLSQHVVCVPGDVSVESCSERRNKRVLDDWLLLEFYTCRETMLVFFLCHHYLEKGFYFTIALEESCKYSFLVQEPQCNTTSGGEPFCRLVESLLPLPNCFICNFKVDHLSVSLLRPITLNSCIFFTEMLPWGDCLSNYQTSAELLALLAVAIPSANS